MKKCLIFKEGNSQKFWNIEAGECDFTVTYGKLGTDGQTSSKTFDSAEKCEKEVEKLISQKLKKGYTEIDEDDLKDQKNDAKKYCFDYDEGDAEALAEKILNEKKLPELKNIIVGSWGESFESSPLPIVDMMIENKDKFAHIESMFFGDMDYEECEVSWIIQTDYSKFLSTFPNLKSFKIKKEESSSAGVRRIKAVIG